MRQSSSFARGTTVTSGFGKWFQVLVPCKNIVEFRFKLINQRELQTGKQMHREIGWFNILVQLTSHMEQGEQSCPSFNNGTIQMAPTVSKN
jgi:hypothetical protein